jgi:RNA polymerase sigma factor (sigma-70 family)
MTFEETLERFYRNKYQTLVKNYSIRCGSVEDAEDIVQEAFTRALTYKSSYKPEEYFSNWMTRIVYHCFCDWKRDQKLQGGTITFNEEDHEPKDGADSKEEFAAFVRQMMKDETERAQEVINLAYCCNYRSTEIAKFLDLSKNTVDWYTMTFRERIKEYVKKAKIV